MATPAQPPPLSNTTPAFTNEVSLIAGDVLRTIHTPAILPSDSPSTRTGADAATTGTPAARRLSTGEAFAAEAGIDLRAIGHAEARKIMSVEHKVLGFRPPPGSLAAAAQAAAARHPEGGAAEENGSADEPDGPNAHVVNATSASAPLAVDAQKLCDAAREDAQRILAERTSQPSYTILPKSPDNDVVKPKNKPDSEHPSSNSQIDDDIDLEALSPDDARTLMSAEHRALGFRPPAGSLAAKAMQVSSATANGNRHTINETGAGLGSGRNTKRRRSSASSATASATSLPARTRRLSNQDGAGTGKRSGNSKCAGGGDASAANSTTSVKDKDNSRDDGLRAAALRDAIRIQSLRTDTDADPRSQVLTTDAGGDGEIGVEQGIELGMTRLARADVNNLAAQPQSQNQVQNQAHNPASPSAYTAASFPSSLTSSPLTPTATATQAIPGIGTDVVPESAGPAARLIAPAPAPRTGTDGPVETGGYVEDDEGEGGSGRDERGRLVRTETEESVEIIGDVLE